MKLGFATKESFSGKRGENINLRNKLAQIGLTNFDKTLILAGRAQVIISYTMIPNPG
uniref:Uncharacterized protein n=1 Tax=Gloeothece verrucosa (strain PCC 7822) TaxID=497965 RepID=E0UBK8_GLOV7|nr:hypothetical protein Cyan7822_1970 [Gloeothece verrucosa PCC 7822]